MKNETTATKANTEAQKCLCGASTPNSWTAGIHHGIHKCARVITKFLPGQR